MEIHGCHGGGYSVILMAIEPESHDPIDPGSDPIPKKFV